MKHIPKSEMEAGAWYTGWCRNTMVAKWDGDKEMFVHIGYSFDYQLNWIDHFDDVIDSGIDGFVPFEKLENPKLDKEKRDYVHSIGY